MANLIAPCQPYVSHDQLAACCKQVDADSDPETSLTSRQVASSFLYYMTGQQYQGLCDAFIRPNYRCSPCPDGRRWTPTLIDGHWLNIPCGAGCGCNENYFVELGHWDVDSVEAVYIDGELVNPASYNFVYPRLYLTSAIPLCQDWTAPAFPDESDNPGAVGTWGIHIIQGTQVPPMLVQAAAELACHYQNLCDDDCNTCRFAVGLASQETIDYALNEILPWVYTGIPTVDTAIRVLNPLGHGRVQARIWSPEAASDAFYGA